MQRITLVFTLLVFGSQLAISQTKVNKATGKSGAQHAKSSPPKKIMNDTIHAANGLQIIITKKNKNPKAAKGDEVKVHYKGMLTDGTVFDESISGGIPFSFECGSHSVIEGWEESMKYLGKGEKATLIIPSEMGYGASGQGSIPPNATLIFEVELMDVIKVVPISLVGKKVLTTASGMKYYYLKKATSAKNKPLTKVMKGDLVKVHYTGRLMNGKKFDSSVDRGQPYQLTVGAGRVIQGWEEALELLNVGDKAAFVIPAKLAYGDREVGGGIIPANSDLYFEIEVMGTSTPIKPDPHPLNIEGKQIQTTASGLQYIIVKKSGSGIKPAFGQNVKVHYTGSLVTTGKKFDSSLDRGEPIGFPLGQGRVIKGWDEGIAMMEVGDCYRFIIPPQLGYGDQNVGNGLIPPNSTLIFDCQLMDIE